MKIIKRKRKRNVKINQSHAEILCKALGWVRVGFFLSVTQQW